VRRMLRALVDLPLKIREPQRGSFAAEPSGIEIEHIQTHPDAQPRMHACHPTQRHAILRSQAFLARPHLSDEPLPRPSKLPTSRPSSAAHPLHHGRSGAPDDLPRSPEKAAAPKNPLAPSLLRRQPLYGVKRTWWPRESSPAAEVASAHGPWAGAEPPWVQQRPLPSQGQRRQQGRNLASRRNRANLLRRQQLG